MSQEKIYASMSEVVMKKQELLDALVENKAKHDVVLAAAISGYWDTAQVKLNEKKQKFLNHLTEFEQDVDKEFNRVAAKIKEKEELPGHLSIRAFGVDSNLGLVYPQDHSKDYERAIRMMEASVFDEVRLSVDEFDAYVLNNWEWKQNFLATNTIYFNSLRGKAYDAAVSGCIVGACGPTGPKGVKGDYGAQYSRATSAAYNTLMGSGLGAF